MNSFGNQAFSFIGTQQFGGGAGKLQTVHANGDTYVNGDGFADLQIELFG